MIGTRGLLQLGVCGLAGFVEGLGLGGLEKAGTRSIVYGLLRLTSGTLYRTQQCASCILANKPLSGEDVPCKVW